MKMSHVEVTDPGAEPWAEGTRNAELRPYETEADKIAAAAPFGHVIVRAFMDLFEHDWGVHDSRTCVLCSTDSGTVLEYWVSLRKDQEAEMAYYEVDWDPAIRL